MAAGCMKLPATMAFCLPRYRCTITEMHHVHILSSGLRSLRVGVSIHNQLVCIAFEPCHFPYWLSSRSEAVLPFQHALGVPRVGRTAIDFPGMYVLNQIIYLPWGSSWETIEPTALVPSTRLASTQCIHLACDCISQSGRGGR